MSRPDVSRGIRTALKTIFPRRCRGNRRILLDIHAKFELQDCPYCGGAGLLEEENGWCWYVTCMDCGSHTASFEFKTPQESEEAAGKAALLVLNRQKHSSTV